MDSKNVFEIQGKLTADAQGVVLGTKEADGAVSKYAASWVSHEKAMQRATDERARKHKKAWETITGNLKSAGEHMSNLAGQALKWEAAIAGVAAGGAVALIIKGITDLAKKADELDELNTQLGVTAEKMQSLQLIAQGAGIGPEKLTTTLSLLQKNLEDAVQAKKDAAQKTLANEGEAQNKMIEGEQKYHEKRMDLVEQIRRKSLDKQDKYGKEDAQRDLKRLDTEWATEKATFKDKQQSGAFVEPGQNKTLEALSRLGLDPDKLAAMPVNESMGAILKAASSLSTNERSGVLRDIGGRSFGTFAKLPVGADFDALVAKMQKMGGVIPQAKLDLSKNAADAFEMLRGALSSRIASTTSPVYTQLINPALKGAEDFLMSEHAERFFANMESSLSKILTNVFGEGFGKGDFGKKIEEASTRFEKWAGESKPFFDNAKNFMTSVGGIAKWMLENPKLTVGVTLATKVAPDVIGGLLGGWVFGKAIKTLIGGKGAGAAVKGLVAGGEALAAGELGVGAGGALIEGAASVAETVVKFPAFWPAAAVASVGVLTAATGLWLAHRGQQNLAPGRKPFDLITVENPSKMFSRPGWKESPPTSLIAEEMAGRSFASSKIGASSGPMWNPYTFSWNTITPPLSKPTDPWRMPTRRVGGAGLPGRWARKPSRDFVNFPHYGQWVEPTGHEEEDARQPYIASFSPAAERARDLNARAATITLPGWQPQSKELGRAFGSGVVSGQRVNPQTGEFVDEFDPRGRVFDPAKVFGRSNAGVPLGGDHRGHGGRPLGGLTDYGGTVSKGGVPAGASLESGAQSLAQTANTLQTIVTKFLQDLNIFDARINNVPNLIRKLAPGAAAGPTLGYEGNQYGPPGAL